MIMDDKTNRSPCFITSGYSKVICRFGSNILVCKAYTGTKMDEINTDTKTRLKTFLNANKFLQKSY
ncbi:protein of unknown function [Nitrosotalea devaniterrae]|uniref:Uncharacterized protein n=1 Tax=Nitrosotalea devaniterrae TaxID=1078905 RepID=A0A128A224_9ARCH|nr:protein of unknown function [Candidatus Nitrosotalea devanaterra]